MAASTTDRFTEKIQLDYVRIYGWVKNKNGLYIHKDKSGAYNLGQAYREQKFNS